MAFLSDFIKIGVIADRPAAGVNGRLYFSTDEAKTYRDNGTSWADVSDGAAGSGTPTTRTISTTAPLTGGGDLSANRTLAISNFTGDSGSGGTKGAVPAPGSGDAASGKYLSADGTWAVPTGSGSGSVSSVALTVPSFLSISGSPITTTGTLVVSLSGTALPVANGGTGTTTSTGTGNVVLSSSPTLVTPALGTPSAAVLTNATGLPLSTGVTGTLAVTHGGTGTTTSTGTGNTVLSTSPTLVTPVLGTPTSATLTNATGLPLTTGVTGILPVANGGTGTSSPGIVAGTNVTVTGTWPNQTVNSSGGGGGSSYYQTVQHDGSAVTQRAQLNIAAGANVTVSASDNGTDTTTLTIASTGGGGGTPSGSETVSFSATPTFSTSTLASVITLTANITSFTLGAGSDGQLKTLVFLQDSTGGWTVTAPSNVLGFFTPGTTASGGNTQMFVYSTGLSKWLAVTTGTVNLS